jgi:protein TonB
LRNRIFNQAAGIVNILSPPLNSSLEKEAIRVVKLMPSWKPYTSFEEEAPIKFGIPINFTLPKKK